jgi:hypothetical protein
MRTNTGRPGHSTYTEYQRAREHQALLRRDRLRRRLPKAALRALPVAAVIGAILALGAHAPAAVTMIAFIVVLAGWPLLVLLRAYDPVPDIEVLRETAEAERDSARTIARLRRRGYFILHDRCVLGPDKTSEGTVAHMLIGPGGVFVINSDPAKGVVRYAKDGVTADGYPLRPVIDTTAWFGGQVRSQLRSALPMVKVPVTPMIVMTEADVLWSDGAVDDVMIISIKDVTTYIRDRPGRVNPSDVAKLVAAAERLFPPFSAAQLATEVTLDWDQWVALTDALRTILERGGDASGILGRLAQIERDLLARHGDSAARAGLPPRAAGGTDGPEFADESDGERRGERRRGGAVLTAVRPLDDEPEE